ncbi:MAG: HAD family hydrolase [Bacteroidetes bacterium]|nr:MAG: HAD family hydrolase [Bacteroidota bacterium]
MNKAVFLDRDGVLNEDNPDYVWEVGKFHVLPRVPEAIKRLKEAGFVLVVVTNQSGIAKGIYTAQDVLQCWEYLQSVCGGLIDAHYFAPYHPSYNSASLTRKPDSLMIEKAIAKFNIDRQASWLVGDSERDIIAAHKQQIRTIKVRTGKNETSPTETDLWANDLWEACDLIVGKAS